MSLLCKLYILNNVIINMQKYSFLAIMLLIFSVGEGNLCTSVKAAIGY